MYTESEDYIIILLLKILKEVMDEIEFTWLVLMRYKWKTERPPTNHTKMKV